MIDWFVLLPPLILLPIVLLLVFVGCAELLALDEISSGLPVTFRYQPDIGADLQSIQVTWEGSLASNLAPLTLDKPDITQLGDQISVGVSSLSDGGAITCRCTVKLDSAEEAKLVTQKPKIQDEDPPSFLLTRTGNDFDLN